MKNGLVLWSDLLHEHALPVQRVAWFTLGSIEREHRLNLDAWMGYWLRASLALWAPALPRRDARCSQSSRGRQEPAFVIDNVCDRAPTHE